MPTYKERMKMETDDAQYVYRYALCLRLYQDYFERRVAMELSQPLVIVDNHGLRQQDKAIQQARGVITSLLNGRKEKNINHGVAQLSTAGRVVWTYWLDGQCRIVRENCTA